MKIILSQGDKVENVITDVEDESRIELSKEA